MVRASMATRNKKRLQLSDSDSQFNHEGEYGQNSQAYIVEQSLLLPLFC